MEVYGKMVFAQAMIGYLMLMVEYGFSWSTARKIAAHRHDRDFISRTFVAAFVGQWLLVALAFLLCGAVVLCVDRLREDMWLYAAAFTSVIGGALFPIWLLEGLERMRTAAILQIAPRLMAVIPVFFVVQAPSDAIWVLVLSGAGTILGGVGSVCWIRLERVVDWHWPGWPAVARELRDGLSLFGSRLSVSVYTTLVPLVLGWVAGPSALAYFNVADKIRGAAQALIGPISQALFPRVNLLVEAHASAAFQLIRRGFWAVLLVASFSGLSMWLLADWLVWLMAGDGFREAATVLRCMSPLPVIVGLSNVLGVQIMLPKRMTGAFSTILFLAAVAATVLLFPLTRAYSSVGAALTVLVAEVIVSASMAALLWQRGYLAESGWRHG